MRNPTKGKLARFLTAYDRKHLPLLIILYVGIASILIFPVSMEENSMAWFGGYLSCPAICLYLTVKLGKAYRRLSSQLKALEEEGMLAKILADLSTAEKAIGGNLYIGDLGLYGKGSNTVLLYRDMTHIYSVLSDRRGQNPRDLMYEDALGEGQVLCYLDPIGQANSEIERLYRIVEKKNPAVKTGT